MADSWTATFYRLATTGRDPERQPFNPRPAGVIREGSTTAKVLALLQASPRRRWREGDIQREIGASRGATSWALYYLRSQGLVEAIPHLAPGVPQRYQLYCHAPSSAMDAPFQREPSPAADAPTPTNNTTERAK